MYLIFLFIDTFTSSPIARAKDANDVTSVGEPYGQDTVANLAETIVVFLVFATLGQVLCNDTTGIGKGLLRRRERYSSLGLPSRLQQ